MKISKDKFFSVGSDLNISKEKMDAFWSGLEKMEEEESTPFAKCLFYLGALIVISAMTWFMNLGWALFGGGGIFIIALIYACIFTLVGKALWNKKGLRLPAGLLITIAVCMAPLAIYGLETYFNLWPTDTETNYPEFYQQVEGRWVLMEIGTILAGVVALWFFPFPFLTAPIFFAAWFLTMDIIPLIFGKELEWNHRCWISLCFGLALMAIGFTIDRAKKGDYAFWSYLFGTVTFWGSLNCLAWDKGEFILFIYLLINLLMMCLSVLLKRTVLMVFGAFGLFAYLGHLAHNIFKDSVLFPFALSFIGLVIIYLGVLYQKNLEWMEKNIFEKLPDGFKKFLDHDVQ